MLEHPQGGTISSASGHCQIFPGGESQLVENHRPKELNLNRGLGRKKEFYFRSVDALFRELLKVLNASWRSETNVQKRVSLVPPTAVCLGQGSPMYSQIGNQTIAKHKVIFDSTFLRLNFYFNSYAFIFMGVGKKNN